MAHAKEQEESFSFDVDKLFSPRACRDKVAFKTKRECEAYRKHLETSTGTGVILNSYKCWSCKKWHVGKLKSKIRKEIDDNDEDSQASKRAGKRRNQERPDTIPGLRQHR